MPLKRQGLSIEVLGGARWPVKEAFEAFALAGVGFGNAPGTPDFRLLLGMAYGRPRPAAVEVVPPVKEPEPPPAPKDTDGDGVVDGEDACPAATGTLGMKGCPDEDNDGIEDGADKCPTEAGPAERQGCPPKDSDGDGALDEVDACPTEPGPLDHNGCPPSDRDNDAVEDQADNCPDEFGTPDNQGCPPEQKQLVVIQRDRIKINDTVTSTSTRRPFSRARSRCWTR